MEDEDERTPWMGEKWREIRVDRIDCLILTFPKRHLERVLGVLPHRRTEPGRRGWERVCERWKIENAVRAGYRPCSFDFLSSASSLWNLDRPSTKRTMKPEGK